MNDCHFPIQVAFTAYSRFNPSVVCLSFLYNSATAISVSKYSVHSWQLLGVEAGLLPDNETTRLCLPTLQEDKLSVLSYRSGGRQRQNSSSSTFMEHMRDTLKLSTRPPTGFVRVHCDHLELLLWTVATFSNHSSFLKIFSCK
jgi:hypothetical protein